MPHPWIDFVKQWAATHNVKYGCAMDDPKMREAYHSRNEVKPKPEFKSDFDSDSDSDSDSKPVITAKKGRPVKHKTVEAKYTAKLPSNKQKRREKAEAKYST